MITRRGQYVPEKLEQPPAHRRLPGVPHTEYEAGLTEQGSVIMGLLLSRLSTAVGLREFSKSGRPLYKRQEGGLRPSRHLRRQNLVFPPRNISSSGRRVPQWNS